LGSYLGGDKLKTGELPVLLLLNEIVQLRVIILQRAVQLGDLEERPR